ncbi:MAG: hypothetical protein P4L98_07670 [Ancalomicrobiaceae bacterium]|nr:hypothetical protein [Ancalomicrobiaceae bacterium]
MSCEPAVPRRRTLLGWLLLALLACLVGFYLHVLGLVATPHVDEAYTRAYLTGEFAVYPSSVGWRPGDGLDYTPGTFTDLRGSEARRNWLARFDWHRVGTPVVTLVGYSGRLFLHLTGEPDAASQRHRLRLGLVCRLPLEHAGDLVVSVNGTEVARAYCGEGLLIIDRFVPAGLLGARRYDEIRIDRTRASIFETILTRLGFRADAVELDWFAVDGE